MDRLRRFAPLLYLALLPILPLWRAVFMGEAIGPFDQIRHMAPWSAAAPDQPWDVLQADGALQFYGWRAMVLEAWSKGQVPGWNAFELAGTPLLANSQSAGFYPPLVLLGVLHVPATLAITLLAWLHLFLAGWGVFRLVRAMGGKEIPAAMAGGLFSSSTFMLGWTGLSSVIYTCAWIPWAISFLLACVEGEGKVPKRGPLLGLGLSVAMMFLAGHLQFAAFGSIALGLVWIVKLVDRRFVASGMTALMIVFGVGLAAPQILPALNYSKFSHRRNTPTEEGYNAYTALAIKPFELANLASPTVLGNPRKWASPSDDPSQPLPPISTYWPLLVKPGANLAESAITVGPLLLLGLFLVPWLKRRYWPMAKVGAVGLLIAMGTPLDRLLYFGVPGWSATGSPGRAIVLFVLAACVVGGLILSEEDLPEWTSDKTKLGLALLGTLLPFALCRTGGDAVPQKLLSEAAAGGILDWVIGTAVAGVCLFLYKKREEILYLAPIGAMLSLLFVIVPTGKPLDPVQGPTAGGRVAVINQRWDILTNQPALLPPNTAALSQIHELGGYDSLLHVDTVNLLKTVDGEDPAPPANGNMMFVKNRATKEAMADAGVTEIWFLKMNGGDRANAEVEKVPIPGPGRVSTPAGPGEIVDEGYDHITVKAKGPGKLTLRDRNMPGWTATVDGAPATVSGALWREVDLADGEHTVNFRYDPPGRAEGTKVFFLAILLMGGVAAVTARR